MEYLLVVGFGVFILSLVFVIFKSIQHTSSKHKKA
jgi:hypothetical protein